MKEMSKIDAEAIRIKKISQIDYKENAEVIRIWKEASLIEAEVIRMKENVPDWWWSHQYKGNAEAIRI